MEKRDDELAPALLPAVFYEALECLAGHYEVSSAGIASALVACVTLHVMATGKNMPAVLLSCTREAPKTWQSDSHDD